LQAHPRTKGLMGGQCYDTLKEYRDQVYRWEELWKHLKEEAKGCFMVRTVQQGYACELQGVTPSLSEALQGVIDGVNCCVKGSCQ